MSQSKPKRVLVIDDDRSNRETFVEILEMEGFSPVSASNGKEGIDRLKEGEAPNLILLDLMMPVMDGFTFRREQMRDPNWSTIPVIVLSADGHVKEKLTEIGAVAYLRKPPDLDAFIEAIRKHSS